MPSDPKTPQSRHLDATEAAIEQLAAAMGQLIGKALFAENESTSSKNPSTPSRDAPVLRDNENLGPTSSHEGHE